MRLFTLALLIGICSLWWARQAIPLPGLWLCGCIVLCYNRWLPSWSKGLLVILLGFSLAHCNIDSQLKTHLPDTALAQVVTVVGDIVSLPEQLNYGKRFELKTRQIAEATAIYKLRLVWPGYSPVLAPGQRWRLQVKLKPPHGVSNPYGFSQTEWLFAHGIQATGYVIRASTNQLIDDSFWRAPLTRVRQYLAQQIERQLPNNSMIGLITALAVGVRDQITESQWQTMRGTGTNHLMAIAGLHIGFVAGSVMWLMNFLWRRWPAAMLWLPAQQAAAIAGLLAAIIYSALAGFALPTVRAVIMLAVFLMSLLWRRRLPPWQAFMLAMLVILILQPRSVMEMSFWLSFGAVGTILYAHYGRMAAGSGLWQWSKLQWIVAVGLLPLSVLFFHQIPIAGIIANSIAIPWVGFIVLPLSLIGTDLTPIFPLFAGCLLQLAVSALALMWHILEWIAAESWLQWYPAAPSIMVFIFSYIGILLLLAPRGMPTRWLGIVWLLPLFIWKPSAPIDNEVWMTLLDVGDATAMVVRTRHHILLYTAGIRHGSGLDLIATTIEPFLLSSGLNQVDVWIDNHRILRPDVSFEQRFKAVKIKHYLSNTALQKNNYCQQSLGWTWEGVNYQFLPMVQAGIAPCILQIKAGQQTWLILGELNKSQAVWLQMHKADLLPADLLITPGHGNSKTEVPALNAMIHPRYVFYSVAYLNRFHFPSAEVLANWQRLGAKVMTTAESGAIMIKTRLNASVPVITIYRGQGR